MFEETWNKFSKPQKDAIAVFVIAISIAGIISNFVSDQIAFEMIPPAFVIAIGAAGCMYIHSSSEEKKKEMLV